MVRSKWRQIYGRTTWTNNVYEFSDFVLWSSSQLNFFLMVHVLYSFWELGMASDWTLGSHFLWNIYFLFWPWFLSSFLFFWSQRLSFVKLGVRIEGVAGSAFESDRPWAGARAVPHRCHTFVLSLGGACDFSRPWCPVGESSPLGIMRAGRYRLRSPWHPSFSLKLVSFQTSNQLSFLYLGYLVFKGKICLQTN